MLNLKRKNILLFLQFLILGLSVGIIEDLIAVTLATDTKISYHLIGIVFLVTLPFSIIGELIVDKIDVPHLGHKTELFLEFLAFGVVMGIVEDIIAIKIVTGEAITLHILVLITLVAIPFAAFSELIVDRFKIA
ncbi:MAG: hypothetical protein ACD_57C00022G0003 [uncultured bacterium]|uniref:Uncharacterized protein n=1 Tax=Candidatus Curtissbacteria bacterium RIFOXYA1_FULL_41_14 TaxID=1797737 RepID=A0A1F5HBA7_9BACT|nr:MAG: hypothetical protein ACD_57C00022G0003 [uncultured bacterium]KKR58027.1 MAG: hypothetical protein UT95_C0011G0023 [Candidatus Curtissbacteria bacterium GW2011_GWB1_40_28]KKR60288.1 MAG: hypothetical protein UT99_C0016G0006 [Candidatus Curtissbacteria bacterium GW2011_GWA2_40_31]KKR61803.1 MAG: hypothetical protein UU00_C0007G0005 [Microgenomates group bacterium GW2011_GWC1_40_35]KKR65879.1 MAG: hypothetical protein UU05_C0009G0024 [Candidatus Curtissbacteria bacterium GW2011_GWA1_40_47]